MFRRVTRHLIRQPGFALTVVGTLAIGIGLATAVATVGHAVLVRPLPMRDQSRLVVLYGETGDARFANFPFGMSDVRDFTDRSRTIAQTAYFAYYGAAEQTLIDRTQRVQLRRAMVSGNFFDVLGTPAELGRPLRPDDDVAGAAPVVVLSHRAWVQHFGGDSSVVGRVLDMFETHRRVVVVGVMPVGMDYPDRADFWAPLTATSTGTADSLHLTSDMLDIVARLRPGATVDQARAELTAWYQRPGASVVERTERGVAGALPDFVVGDTRPALVALGIVSGLLLLLASANVANLLLVRGLGRTREVAVRMALGAGRWRVARDLLAESAVLAALGGGLGAGTAVVAVAVFRRIAPPGLARVDEVAPDASLFALAILVATASLMVFSVAPALLGSRADPGAALHGGGRTIGGSRGVRVATEWLVVAQVAFAAVTLAAAGLTVRSLVRLRGVDLAYEPHRLQAAEIVERDDRAGSTARRVATFDALAERIRAVPGVDAATPVLHPPFQGGSLGIDGMLQTRGQSPEQVAANPILNFEVVAPEYFATLGTRLVSGRAFGAGDRTGAPAVVIVSRETAVHYWPGADPLGKTLVIGGRSAQTFEVVGVAPDVRYRDLRASRPTVYFPEAQSFFPVAPRALLIRTAGQEAVDAGALRRAIEAADADVRLVSVTPFDVLLAKPEAQPRMTAVLLATFAAAAVLLAAVGIFSVIAAGMKRRRREIGIRLALGATAAHASRLIVARGLVLAAGGVLIGLAAAAAVSRTLSSLLFETSPTDALTLVGAGLTLMLVAGAASAVPATWASRVDPAIALRDDG